MTMTIRATYEKGVLRPAQPLALKEGATVDLEIIERIVPGTAMPPPTPEEAAYIERLKAAKSLKEAFAIMDTAPGMALPPPTPEEEAFMCRVKATSSLQELFEVAKDMPPFPEGYDLLKALNENRKAAGEMPLYPELDED